MRELFEKMIDESMAAQRADIDTIRRWDAKFNEFLFLEKFMFVSYFLVIFHDYFIIDSF